jgi:MoxR-like ATPase
MISPEELARIRKLADNYINPPVPRAGHQTIALYDELNDLVMKNLMGLLEAAERGVRS